MIVHTHTDTQHDYYILLPMLRSKDNDCPYDYINLFDFKTRHMTNVKPFT